MLKTYKHTVDKSMFTCDHRQTVITLYTEFAVPGYIERFI